MQYRIHEASRGSAVARVASKALKEPGTGSYSFPDLGPIDQRYVMENIYGFEKLLEAKEGSPKYYEGLRRQRRFRESIPYLIKQLARSYIELIRPSVRVDGVAPIADTKIHAEYPQGIPKIAMLEMVRYGSWATEIFLDEMLEFFGLVDFRVVTVMGQRTGETLEELDTDPSFKGFIGDLPERDLIVVDPFLASGKSVKNAVFGNQDRNRGQVPRSFTQLSIHCRPDGMSRLIDMELPNTNILAIAEHEALDDHGYMVGPSGGDGGRRHKNAFEQPEDVPFWHL